MRRHAAVFMTLVPLFLTSVSEKCFGRGLGDTSGGIKLDCQKNFHIDQSVEEFYNKYHFTVGCKAGEEKRAVSFTFNTSFHKPTGDFVEEITSSEGYSLRIESVYPEDPYLGAKSVNCSQLKSESGNLLSRYGIPPGACSLAYLFVSDAHQQALASGFQSETTGNPTTPPMFKSPKENSAQKDPGRVVFSLFTPWWPTQPCREWKFHVQLERWDAQQGSNGKWVGGPFYEFQGFSTNENICRGEVYPALNPGKYRATGKVRHRDGWSTPWSLKIGFLVKSQMAGLAQDAPLVEGATGLSISKPNGGETFRAGETIFVRWNSFGVDGKVKVILQKGGAVSEETALGEPLATRGLYRWKVPGGTAPGKDYKVMIVSEEDDSVKDESNGPFTIQASLQDVAGKRELMSPKTQQQVQPDLDKRELMSPKTQQQVQPDIDKQAAVSPKTQQQVQLNKSQMSAQVVRKITVDSPKGGESWFIGDSRNIKWKSTGVSGKVNVTLQGGGSTKNLTPGGTSNDGSFSWTVAGTPANDYRIVVKTTDGSAEGKSQNTFTIKMKLQQKRMRVQ